MLHARSLVFCSLFAGSLVAQTNNDVGFTRGWTTSYTDRIGANTIVADVMNRFDNRDYLDWMLDPADTTGSTFKFNAIRVVLQDQVGTTPETYSVVAYNEDPAVPDFPDATAPWLRTGALNMPTSTTTTAVAWIITVTLPPTAPTAPKGDKWIGVQLNLPATGSWPTDGVSIHTAYDRAPGSTGTAATDQPGLGAATINVGQYACHMPLASGLPQGPAIYPTPTPGSRRQIRMEVIANVTGGVCVTQTNQSTYASSNPGVANSTPLGGTTNFFSGLHPDVYDGNLSSPARADDIGFLVSEVNLPNSPVFVILSVGPSPIGSVPLASITPAVANPNTRGNVCIDFVSGVTFFGVSGSTGLYQHMLTLNPVIRSAIQGLSLPGQPYDIWYQGFVLNPNSSGGGLEVRATGCGKQHL
ncbi:MAG: hypothetical protein RL148_2062 [Planctomycetota bacterium]|jgi:hypothetical protein